MSTTGMPFAVLMIVLAGSMAEKMTFFVSPDTHFTLSGGVPTSSKTLEELLIWTDWLARITRAAPCGAVLLKPMSEG